jgi:tetratricopeptide (TPR) repeat protein
MTDTPRIEDLKRRVQSDPASIAFAALAEEYRRAGRFEEAIGVCTTGLVRHPSYLSARVTLGRALIEVGRFEEAKNELEFVLNLAPENLAAIRGLADIHHRRGEDMHAEYAAADQARYGSGAPDAPVADAALPDPAPGISPAPVSSPFADAYAHTPPPDSPAIVDLQPALAVEPQPAPEPAREPAVEQIAAASAAGRPPDPALARLEGFLHAIIRARA